MLARDCTIHSLVSYRCISAVASFPRSQEVRSQSAMRSCAASELDVIPVVDRRASVASLVADIDFRTLELPFSGFVERWRREEFKNIRRATLCLFFMERLKRICLWCSSGGYQYGRRHLPLCRVKVLVHKRATAGAFLFREEKEDSLFI